MCQSLWLAETPCWLAETSLLLGWLPPRESFEFAILIQLQPKNYPNEKITFSKGLSTRGMLIIGIWDRLSMWECSCSGCLPLKLFTTHTTCKEKENITSFLKDCNRFDPKHLHSFYHVLRYKYYIWMHYRHVPVFTGILLQTLRGHLNQWILGVPF